MLPSDINKWTNNQIVIFARWLSNRNHLVFCSIDMIKRHLTTLDIPHYIMRAKQHTEITYENKFKHVYCIALGTHRKHIAIRLKKHPSPSEKVGGLWTHQLVLVIMVYAKLLKMPTIPIDVGGNSTLGFCIKVFQQFIKFKSKKI